MTDTPDLPILLLCKDLLFSSRISSTAQALGIRVVLLRDPAKLLDQPAIKLILDLNLPGAIPAAAAWQRLTASPAIGFVSHTDADTIAAARSAGIQTILPRSLFVQNLPQIVQSPPID